MNAIVELWLFSWIYSDVLFRRAGAQPHSLQGPGAPVESIQIYTCQYYFKGVLIDVNTLLILLQTPLCFQTFNYYIRCDEYTIGVMHVTVCERVFNNELLCKHHTQL
jgi:hypothetical protein